MPLSTCESSSQPFYRSAGGFQQVINPVSCYHIAFTRVGISLPSDRLSSKTGCGLLQSICGFGAMKPKPCRGSISVTAHTKNSLKQYVIWYLW